MWWRIIFSENAENSHVKHRDLADEDFSFEFAHFVGLAVWAVYQIMVSIIMLNILIAIMNSTYGEVWGRIDREYRYSKTYYEAQFFGPHAAFPPPFQWVYLIVQMVYNIKKKEASKREERNVMDKKKKYFDCLKEVIQVKQQKDKERTLDESLSCFQNDLLEQFDSFLKNKEENSLKEENRIFPQE